MLNQIKEGEVPSFFILSMSNCFYFYNGIQLSTSEAEEKLAVIEKDIQDFLTLRGIDIDTLTANADSELESLQKYIQYLEGYRNLQINSTVDYGMTITFDELLKEFENSGEENTPYNFMTWLEQNYPDSFQRICRNE